MMSQIIRLTLVVSIFTAAWGCRQDCLGQDAQTEKPKSHKSTADEIPWSLSSQSDQPAKDKADKHDNKDKKAKKNKEAKTPEPKATLYERMTKLGDEQMAKKEYTLARATFRELCWRRPMDPIPMLKEAAAAAKCGDLDEALVWAKKATQYAPNYDDAHIQLGHLLEANRDWKAAYLQYARALDLVSDPESRISLETPMLRTLLKTKDYDKAEQLSLSMIKQNKKTPDCYYNRAWYLSQSPKPEALAEAIDNYKQVLTLTPDRNDARFNLALLLVKNNAKEEAAVELKKFIDAAPDDPDCPRAKDILEKLESARQPEKADK
jgi:tetratricopeptide (TPR) repeat protein